MRARAMSRSLTVAATLLVACRGADELPTRSAVWPPEEGNYCADALDVCAPDGTVWRCGPRPFWQQVDCTEVCAAQGGTPNGCLMPEPREQAAAAALADPAGLLADDLRLASTGARCLCDNAVAPACAGPSHRTCAGRGRIWSCTESLQWRADDCAAKCAAQDPPMVLDQCQHQTAWPADGCRCTLLAAPCADEGAWLCADGTEWLRCEQGAWRLGLSCAQDACEQSQIGTCDHASTAPACRCTEAP